MCSQNRDSVARVGARVGGWGARAGGPAERGTCRPQRTLHVRSNAGAAGWEGAGPGRPWRACALACVVAWACVRERTEPDRCRRNRRRVHAWVTGGDGGADADRRRVMQRGLALRGERVNECISDPECSYVPVSMRSYMRQDRHSAVPTAAEPQGRIAGPPSSGQPGCASRVTTGWALTVSSDTIGREEH